MSQCLSNVNTEYHLNEKICTENLIFSRSLQKNNQIHK